VIILAAGQGTRLLPLTAERPKCMVPLAGRPLIEWQLGAARAAGADEIVLVTGYRADALALDGVRTVHNPRFVSTNMVYSLWCARALLAGDCVVVSYGDIVYEPSVLAALFAARAPIAVAVDQDWLRYWRRRSPDPLADAETMRVQPDGRITSIGQRPRTLDEIEGQYIGLTRYDARGCAALTRALADEAEAFERGERALHASRDFAQLYMTDLLQSMAGSEPGVHAVPIHGRWLEIDTPADLALAESLVRADERWLRIER
jgi:choline kinase